MQVIIEKRGGGAWLRIPETVVAATSIEIGQSVDVREENGRIIIEPIRASAYDLGVMLADMKPETFPEEVDFGARIGNEVW
ncbi:PbsX family transcriptional regulator [Caulobacter vibrioides]|uniref:PbsX family transcriptional regulator n=2 Tax=Caulobacter vibrioides TaxID=155892 RepID=A0A290MH14_CAUVI|nr:PbsX family transcriptional regulator [Caulobacter vibrioides]